MHRPLREAGLLGPMRRVASAFDNAMAKSFFGSMQIERLDRCASTTRAVLATADFSPSKPSATPSADTAR